MRGSTLSAYLTPSTVTVTSAMRDPPQDLGLRVNLGLAAGLHQYRSEAVARPVAVSGLALRRCRHQRVQEMEGGGGGLVPPQHQGAVEPGGGGDLVLQGIGDGRQQDALGGQQVMRIDPGSVQQSQLDQQFGADVARVLGWTVLPRRRKKTHTSSLVVTTHKITTKGS